MQTNTIQNPEKYLNCFIICFLKKCNNKISFHFGNMPICNSLAASKEWESDAILVNVDSGTAPSQSGASAIGGIAQLAGINLNTSTASRLNMSLYTILSRDFLDI